VYGSGNGEFNYPFSVATDPAGNVYVADYQNNRIQKFDGMGTYLAQWGSYGSGDLQFISPTGVTTDAAGNVYVIDSNFRIAKFTGSGALIEMWGWGVATGAAALERCTSGCQRGIPGHGDGQLSASYDLAVDAGGNVYVADQGYSNDSRIQKLSSSGTYLAQWGVPGILYAVGADGAGNVYATTYNSVEKYTDTGTHLLTLATSGTGDGQVRVPYGVTTDADGNVYVADTYNHRVQKFSSAGTYLTQWGSFGTGDGEFQYTNDVATDANRNVYVADYFNHRIQKFGPAVDVAQSYYVPQAGTASLLTGASAVRLLRACPNNEGGSSLPNQVRIKIVLHNTVGSGVAGLIPYIKFNGGTLAQGFGSGTGADSIIANPNYSLFTTSPCPLVQQIFADSPTDMNGETRLTFTGAGGVRDPNRKWGHYDCEIPVYVMDGGVEVKILGKVLETDPNTLQFDTTCGGSIPTYGFLLRIKNFDLTGGLGTQSGQGEVVTINDFNAVANAVNQLPNAVSFWRDLDWSGFMGTCNPPANCVTVTDLNIMTVHLNHRCDVPSSP